MNRVLFLTTNQLFPIDSGASRYSTGILKYLIESDFEVTLLNFYTKEPTTNLGDIQNYCSEYYEIKLKRKNLIYNLSFKYPFTVRKYFRQDMINLIDKTIKKSSFDIIIFDHLHMSVYLDYIKVGKKILIEHNVESNIWLSYLRNSKGIKKLIINHQYKKFLEFEKKQLSKLDAIIAISDEDKKELNKFKENLNIAVLNPVIKVDRVKKDDDLINTDNSILFVGDMSWFPNQEAGNFLIHELMPIIRKVNTNVKLYIVGKNPSQDLLDLSEKLHDVIVTGRVESIDPYYKKCDIFINSIYSGSGLNIKLIEALSKGIPVITSKFGCRGLPEDQNCMMIYEDLEDLSKKILYLLDNPSVRKRMSKNAEVYINNNLKPNDEVNRVLCIGADT